MRTKIGSRARRGCGLQLSAALLAGFVLIGSVASSALADTFVFNHLLEPSQEVPPTPSRATGECTVALDDIARTLDVDCTYAGLTGQATAAHVHLAPPGVNGPPILTLNHTGGTSGTVTGFGMLLPDQVQAVLDGNAYINVHSTAFQGGEIRGQIVDSAPPVILHVGGLLHQPVGGATLLGQDIDGNGGLDVLTISNIGSSGEDGVSILVYDDFGNEGDYSSFRITGWSGAIDFGEAGNLPSGMMLNINAPVSIDGGDGVDTIAVVTESDGGNAAVTLAPDCPDCDINVKAYLNGLLVADMDRDGALDVVLTGDFGTGIGGDGLPAPMRFSHHRENPHYTTFDGRIYNFQGTGVSGMGAGQLIEADTILVTSNHPNLATFIGAVQIIAANTGGNDITIKEEALIAASWPDGSLDSDAWRAPVAGAAHMVGTEICEDGDGGLPPACVGAVELSNIGSSGEDGVSIEVSDVLSITGRGTVATGIAVSFDPIVLDLDADGISTLTVASTWCESGSEQDDVCVEPLGMSSWLEATGGPGGALTAHADFSETGSHEAVVQVMSSGALALTVALDTTAAVSLASVTQCPTPGAADVGVVAATDAHHASGQHAPAFIWEFGDTVCIEVAGKVVEGDELRIAPVDLIIDLVYQPRTSITAGSGSGSESLYITGIEPAAVSFTQGHVFGFHHTATDGAELTVGCGSKCQVPPGAGTNPPLVVSGSGTCSGTVAIDVGDAADGFGFTQLVKDEVGTLKGSMKLFSVTGQPSPVGAQLAIGPCPPPPDQDPHCDNLPPGLEDPTYFAVDMSELGATSYTIQAVQHPDVIVANVQTNPPQMARVLFSGHGGSLTVSGTLVVSGGLAGDAQFTDTRYILRAGEPLNIQLPDGTIVVADEVRITAHGIEEELTVQPVLSFECLPEVDDEVLAIIVDEWVELFDLEHRASDAGRLSIVNEDLDDDEVDDRVISLGNPSSGSRATVASNNLRFSASQYHANWGISIPDPCAGKPEPCEAMQDGATLISGATLALDDGGTGHLDMSITPVECSAEGVATHYRGADIYASSSASMGSTTTTAEVLLDGEVVATVPDVTDPVTMCCPDCGHNENWSFDVSHTILDPTIEGEDVQSAISWGSQRIFSFEIPLEGTQSYLGDAVRFIHATEHSPKWIDHTQLTTVHVPEVYITDMTIGDVPEPDPCPADLTGDDSVGVPDLLDLLGAWGPNPNHPADLDNNGNVGVPDLLLLLAAWGACP